MEHSDTTLERSPWTGRWWPVGAIVLLAVVLVAAAAIILGSTQEEASYAVDSPEAALRDYFSAWQEGDADAAYDALSARARASVPRREYGYAGDWSVDSPVRIWVDERVDFDERVVLHLTVEHTWDGLFGPERERHQQRVSMVREDDVWKIDTPMFGYYPW